MQRSAPVKVTAAVGVQYLVGRVEWSVPEEQRLKGSVWPVAGSHSSLPPTTIQIRDTLC